MEGRSIHVSPQLCGISLPDPSDPWAQAGFDVRDDRLHIGSLTVALGRPIQRAAWNFEPSVADTIDGIPSDQPAPVQPEAVVDHPNGAVAVDHIVVMTPDLDRTTNALADTGIELRRSRPIGDREQRFFWAGDTIIEMVGPTEPEGDRPASIWGLALVSEDLDASKNTLGALLSDPRDAVQPGRRIAAIRTKELGISVTIALMTPHVADG